MSLICAETGQDLLVKDPLYTATQWSTATHYALHHGVIERIPHAMRRPTPCRSDEDGVDVHEGVSTPNLPFFAHVYSWSGFRAGRFLFSISPETAVKHLPNLSHLLLARRGHKEAL